MTAVSAFDLISHPDLVAALARLEIVQPTEVQSLAIPNVLAGRDLTVCAPTGSGKTLAFLLPMLQQLLAEPKPGIRALILSPTRELARQIVGLARSLCTIDDINVVAITGGDDRAAQRDLLTRANLVVVTPKRMAEFVQSGDADLGQLEFLVIDEADRTLDLGLADDVMSIALASGSKRQTLLVSATLQAPGIGRFIHALIDSERAEQITLQTEKDTRRHEILLADDFKHRCRLLPALLAGRQFTRAIVFANTREHVTELNRCLKVAGLASSMLHGELDASTRKQVLARFKKGLVPVVVATDLMARGLDITGMDLVVNADLPFNVPAFVHRAGRTGRAEQPGTVVSMVTAQTWNLMADVQRHLLVKAQRITLDGLEGHYQGPKKTKTSGKVAGKKKTVKKAAAAKKAKAQKSAGEVRVKERHRDSKNLGKRRKPVVKTEPPTNDESNV